MKIAVIAANGRSGKVFTELALRMGHSISAGVHGVNTLASHENLSVISCDATNKDDIENLIKGQDAVVSFIGHVKGSPENVQTDAMRVLDEAMHRQGIKRVVSLTGTGVRFPGDKISFVDRVLNASIAVIDPKRIRDGKNHVILLQKTQLEWTIIRVLKLQNVPARAFTLKENGPTKWVVGREEVAQAVLQVLENNTFVMRAPIISRHSKA